MGDLTDSLDDMDWEAEGNDVAATMKPIYHSIFGLAYDQANAAGGLPVDVTYDQTNPHIGKAVNKLATRIKGVSDTTRDNIKSLVTSALKGETDAEGNTNIPSNKEIAKRIREQGDIEADYRSNMIARTETATGLNLGATYAYEDAGVSQVEVMDGDEDEECAAADGQTWSLDDARDNPIAHPNCTRAFSPVVD